ncbi:MAG: NADH-quinone oxidoreductase subunit N [Deltaproteobacteria bacterium]|nr:NADH-quinone oxidoreductase subunit N [Deltaproteobacteria bacterium]
MTILFLAMAKALAPFLALVLSGLLLLIVTAFLPKEKTRLLFYPTLLALAGTTILVATNWVDGFPLEGGMVISDRIAYGFDLVFLLSVFLSTILSRETEEGNAHGGEYYVLTLFATAGMVLMAHSRDLLLLFIALEIMSLSAYILTSYRQSAKGAEAGMKYFVMGAFASGFLLYGIALIYGATGSTDFSVITQAGAGATGNSLWLIRIGVALLLIGFGFKIAAVPFHFWAPDVYEGAPTPVTALMASGVKAAGFVALVRLVIAFAPFTALPWVKILSVLAFLTMTIGNLIALKQTNIKRMLAYSSIAHAGYALVGLAASIKNGQIQEEALAAVLFYMFAYSLMTIGAFAIVVAMGRKGDEVDEIGDYAGLSEHHPALAAAMALFMISLTGIPPTLGFIGKFYLLRAAVSSGLIGLTVVAVLNSVISAFYYLSVVMVIYFQKEKGYRLPQLSYTLLFAVSFTAMAVIYLGLFPEELFQVAKQSFQAVVF